jgi:pyruvate dehydrogenase E1 component
VLAGAYRLVDASGLSSTGAPTVNLAGSGAILPELLAAAKILADEGIAAHVVDVTSLDRLYRSWRLATAVAVHEAKVPSIPGTLRSTFAAGAPLVTVHDASSHAMAWLGAALGVPTISLGVDSFGQSGSLADLYEIHGLVPEVIVNSALAALSLR